MNKIYFKYFTFLTKTLFIIIQIMGQQKKGIPDA